MTTYSKPRYIPADDEWNVEVDGVQHRFSSCAAANTWISHERKAARNEEWPSSDRGRDEWRHEAEAAMRLKR